MEERGGLALWCWGSVGGELVSLSSPWRRDHRDLLDRGIQCVQRHHPCDGDIVIMVFSAGWFRHPGWWSMCAYWNVDGGGPHVGQHGGEPLPLAHSPGDEEQVTSGSHPACTRLVRVELQGASSWWARRSGSWWQCRADWRAVGGWSAQWEPCQDNLPVIVSLPQSVSCPGRDWHASQLGMMVSLALAAVTSAPSLMARVILMVGSLVVILAAAPSWASPEAGPGQAAVHYVVCIHFDYSVLCSH